jgi:hemoglobin
MVTLYDRLGGDAAVIAAVDGFYKRVIADPKLSSFFTGIDMNVQVAKMTEFMSMALGGKPTYAGRDLGEAHAKLVQRGLADTHFDAVVTHLVATLDELGVGSPEIDEVLSILAPTRNAVLGRDV